MFHITHNKINAHLKYNDLYLKNGKISTKLNWGEFKKMREPLEGNLAIFIKIHNALLPWFSIPEIYTRYMLVPLQRIVYKAIY